MDDFHAASKRQGGEGTKGEQEGEDTVTKQSTADVDALLAAQAKFAFLNDALQAIKTAKHRISPEGQRGLQVILRELLELLEQTRGQETEKKRKRGGE